MLSASTPMASAFNAWRTDVHLWMTLIPAPLSSGIHFCGLFPAVSTIFTPPSMIAWM